MRTHALNQARATFSDVFDRALAGEPQRVTRHGKEAVVIVSEAQWQERMGKPALTLGDVIADFGERVDLGDLFARAHFPQTREFGIDFEE